VVDVDGTLLDAHSECDQPILVRADTGGATHALTDHLRQLGVRFSIDLPADERVRAAVLAVAADAWQPAIDVDG
jgi:hypothetical protein